MLVSPSRRTAHLKFYIVWDGLLVYSGVDYLDNDTLLNQPLAYFSWDELLAIIFK